MAPGDTLLHYTDGLTEAMDEAGEQFGIERVCAALVAAKAGSAADLLAALFAALRAFTRLVADDITALLLRHDGPLEEARQRSTTRANAAAATGARARGVMKR